MAWECIESAYDEVMEEPTEFDAFGADKRDALIEAVRVAEEDALCQIAQLGFVPIGLH